MPCWVASPNPTNLTDIVRFNGRLEHLRGSALGFRNLTNYIARSLLETGGFSPAYTLHCEEPVSINSIQVHLIRGAERIAPTVSSIQAVRRPAGSWIGLLQVWVAGPSRVSWPGSGINA